MTVKEALECAGAPEALSLMKAGLDDRRWRLRVRRFDLYERSRFSGYDVVMHPQRWHFVSPEAACWITLPDSAWRPVDRWGNVRQDV